MRFFKRRRDGEMHGSERGTKHGGDYVAEVLKAQEVAFVFTLTGAEIPENK